MSTEIPHIGTNVPKSRGLIATCRNTLKDCIVQLRSTCSKFNQKGNEVSEKTVIVKQSFPVLSALGVTFVVLKLAGVINWSWWLVTMPFWFGIALWGALAILLPTAAAALFGILYLGAMAWDKFAAFKRRRKVTAQKKAEGNLS